MFMVFDRFEYSKLSFSYKPASTTASSYHSEERPLQGLRISAISSTG